MNWGQYIIFRINRFSLDIAKIYPFYMSDFKNSRMI
jgi:hypothetical protein